MADYKLFVPFILRWEGGEVNDKDDRGGHTNKGITRSTFNALSKRVLGKDPTLENFKSLTKADAMKFIRHFWMVATYNNSIQSQAVAEAITSWYWGSGRFGIKEWQKMLRDQFGKKDIKIDGTVGSQTIQYINAIPQDKLMSAAIATRERTFRNIVQRDPRQAKFLRGWLNRLADFTKRHPQMAKTASKAGGGMLVLLGIGALVFLGNQFVTHLSDKE